ncbi:hypothetical protein HK405_004611 [Cladochytrium tenue]|nr:hypothetical protein HK405_004611 [Cladochytrium tenue]
MPPQQQHSSATDLSLTRLDARSHFNALSSDGRIYVYWLSRASWAGARIIAAQTSHRAEELVQLFLDLFSEEGDPSAQGGLIATAKSAAAPTMSCATL